MAAAQQGHSEVETPEDPVREVIRVVVTALLREEQQALMSDMAEYRSNLSRHLLNHLTEPT